MTAVDQWAEFGVCARGVLVPADHWSTLSDQLSKEAGRRDVGHRRGGRAPVAELRRVGARLRGPDGDVVAPEQRLVGRRPHGVNARLRTAVEVRGG